VSFRTRLALASSAAVAIAVIAASAGAYAIVRDELRDEIDRSLRERSAFVEPGFRMRHPRFPKPALGGASGYLQLVGSDGSQVRLDGEEIALPVSERTIELAREGGPEFLTDATVNGTHVRILTAQVAPGVAMQLARPLEEVDAVLSRLRWLFSIVSLLGIGLAATLGLAITRTAAAPLRDLHDALDEITSTGDLSRRVEVSGRDELAQLAESFNRMLGALEASVTAQRQLVADASHELRTPLTSLRTNVEVLARGDALEPDDRAALLRDVEAQLDELTALVADVVELARDGEPVAHVEDVRLDLVAADAVERARRHRPDIDFALEAEESVVRGASDRIGRAIGNLLDNAAKWSSPDGRVEVRVAGGEVTVRDYGPGIDEADLPHVFDRFYRAPAARGLPGSGLGLAIVRQVAEQHGGSASAERAEGGGTLVRLRLAPEGPEGAATRETA
jgi:two-component system sensor histidine kinase MprB